MYASVSDTCTHACAHACMLCATAGNSQVASVLHIGFGGPFREDAIIAGSGPPKAYCGASVMKLSPEQQKCRAEMVDRLDVAASIYPGLKAEHLGSKGSSFFAKHLLHVLPGNFHLIPFAHALLYGWTKDFWTHILPAKQSETTAQAIVMHKLAMRYLSQMVMWVVVCDLRPEMSF